MIWLRVSNMVMRTFAIGVGSGQRLGHQPAYDLAHQSVEACGPPPVRRRPRPNQPHPANSARSAVVRRRSADPQLLAQLQERTADAGSADWLALLARAASRGEVRPQALRPRVATVAVVLLRNEFITPRVPHRPGRRRRRDHR